MPMTLRRKGMRALLGKKFAACHIDRVESHYGNIMIRGWTAGLKKSQGTGGGNLEISVLDGKGKRLQVYTERLVRDDVNQMFGLEAGLKTGFHILVDRAVLDTPEIFLVFSDGKESLKKKLRVNVHGPAARLYYTHFSQKRQEDYDLWVRRQAPGVIEAREQKKQKFARNPLFSVVIPLYNTPRSFLKEIVDSVLEQTYPKVELCLADGSEGSEIEGWLRRNYPREKRIRYRKLRENRGISENTNAAIKMARGEFIFFADHDDVLARDAMYEAARAVNADPRIDVIYTDEDKINRSGTAYFAPHFKPDFSMELLCCNNYICHLFGVRRDLLKKAGLLDPKYDGAQDYDLVLRCCEKAEQICHIPRVLYHWRTHPASTAGNPDSKKYAFEAGRRAVQAHYERMGIPARVENTDLLGRYRTYYEISGNPKVTILIPNRDHGEDLARCIRSVQGKTTYENYEILVIENNSREKETFELYRELQENGEARVITWEHPFQYAAIHNFAVKEARGDYLVFLNNDTEVISESWLEEMLGICQKPQVGAVGAKLFYPDGTIQHAGVILGLGGVAGHIYAGFPGDKDGYAARLVSVQDLSAVTGACMMTKKVIYQELGGMDERFAVAYNDVDYCLRLREAGYSVVFTPYAALYHYESKTRGYEDTLEKQKRLEKETEAFRKRWGELLKKGDPFYNPNLSLKKADCSLRLSGEERQGEG